MLEGLSFQFDELPDSAGLHVTGIVKRLEKSVLWGV